MSTESEAEYYALRAAADWEMSRSAADERVAALHVELAKRYVELAGCDRLDEASRSTTSSLCPLRVEKGHKRRRAVGLPQKALSAFALLLALQALLHLLALRTLRRLQVGLKYRYLNSGVLKFDRKGTLFAGNAITGEQPSGAVVPDVEGEFRTRSLLVGLVRYL